MINREDMLELTRRMTPARTSFTRIAGCYVDADGDFDGSFNINFLKLSASEKTKNLAIAKTIPFAETNTKLKKYEIQPENQKAGSMWQLLMALRDCELKNDALMDTLYDIIMENAIAVNRAIIDEKTIDRVNIYQAAMNGMYEAIYGLNPKPDAVLIDAMPLESLDIYHQSIIKGDSKSASIAAASIVAKVERDRMMNEFDKIYPQYGFAKNKGYGTSEHLEALRKYGPCEIHRKSFEPIKSMVMQK